MHIQIVWVGCLGSAFLPSFPIQKPNFSNKDINQMSIWNTFLNHVVIMFAILCVHYTFCSVLFLLMITKLQKCMMETVRAIKRW